MLTPESLTGCEGQGADGRKQPRAPWLDPEETPEPMSKERPILFSGPMVRAILDGRKTQTRRIVKLPNTTQPDPLLHHIDAFGNAVFTDGSVVRGLAEVGTRLWVRESFWQSGFPANAAHPESGCNDPVWVWGEKVAFDLERTPMGWRKRPSIHMPRWASRITLEVTGVRVERLQDISEEDALAEGADPVVLLPDDDTGLLTTVMHDTKGDHRDGFAALWSSINGLGSWQANPWVWVIDFRLLNQTGH